MKDILGLFHLRNKQRVAQFRIEGIQSVLELYPDLRNVSVLCQRLELVESPRIHLLSQGLLWKENVEADRACTVRLEILDGLGVNVTGPWPSPVEGFETSY